MKRNLFTIFGILPLLCFFGNKANACSDSSTYFLGMTGNFKGGINFVGVKYTYGTKTKTSTWLYEVYVDSKSKDLSHLNIQLGGCLPSSMFQSGGTWSGTLSSPTLNSNSCWSIGKDGSDPTKMYGIKYDCQLNKGGSYKIYFVLKSDYGVTSNTVKMKAGTTHDSSKICGPDLYCGPVPVTWYKVAVEAGDGINLIKWSTTTEIHNEKFEIERSDGRSIFQKIGEVTGAGNSSQILYYEFIDNQPPNKKNYYRVKQIDYDGKFDYSPIFSARSKKEAGLNIYPNPTKSDQTVTINSFGFQEDNDNKVIIHDLVGKVILESVFTGSGNVLHLNLAKGSYIITNIGKNANGRDEVFRQRLIVQ